MCHRRENLPVARESLLTSAAIMQGLARRTTFRIGIARRAAALALITAAVLPQPPARAAAAAVTAGAAPHSETIVYAAASLRDVLQELAPACGKATGTRLVFNFAGSGELAYQIETANKADVFFAADAVTMDEVARAGLVDQTSRRTPLSNRLVVIGPAGTTASVKAAADLAVPRVRRVALADPRSVPAGRYAKAWLVKAGVWEAVKERVLPALDVRAALAAVESGGADLGVVYKTDAKIATRARVLYEVPDADGPKIEYVLAALKDRPGLETSRKVVAWLCGAEAAAVFEASGFITRAPGR
jgi:molybdate transport system substrate-binding protein